MTSNQGWREAVLDALRRYSLQHKTRLITRQLLIDEELATIVQQTSSQGRTPHQTLSRILQELRDDGVLHFKDTGVYVLLDIPTYVESEDFPIEAIDYALEHDKLLLGDVPTSDTEATTRQRRGQQRIRKLTLSNYHSHCAFCDVVNEGFLVAAHIARWADEPKARGNLANVICMCKLHDPLFEDGYFALADDYTIIKKQHIFGASIRRVLELTNNFDKPVSHPPAREFLQKHRLRVGL